MTDLLKAMMSPPSTAMEQTSKAEVARVGSLDRVDSVRGASPITKTTAKNANTNPEMPMWPPTTKLLPERG